MPGRMPSFIVVGLVMIMFLLGFFYMSCSSKTTELRDTLNEFEERIRTLTLKNSDAERKIESINTRKHELEEEKLHVQRQLEKKDSELNDLNRKFNEKSAELQSLKSDRQVIDEQLKEYKNMKDILSSKNSAIGKLQQEFDEKKKVNNEELIQLKQEVEKYKNQLNNQEKIPMHIPNQRFRPLLSPNETSENSSSVFQQSIDKISNITNNIKEKIANAFVGGNNLIANQTDNLQELGQDKPARGLPGNGPADQGQNNADIHQRIPRSMNSNKKQIDTGNAPLNETNIANNKNDRNFKNIVA